MNDREIRILAYGMLNRHGNMAREHIHQCIDVAVTVHDDAKALIWERVLNELDVSLIESMPPTRH